MNIYVKIFIYTAIPFGIIMGLFYSCSGIASGILFGAIMSFVLGTIHKKSLEKTLSPKNVSDSGVKHTVNVDLKLSYDKAFKICLSSISAIKKSKVIQQNYYDGIIEAKAGMTWKSWGDIISFNIQKTNSLNTCVEVTSKPSLSTTVVDYGKNMENIEIIDNYLKEAERKYISHGFKKDLETIGSENVRMCPYCAEEIKMEAIKCKHCGEYFL